MLGVMSASSKQFPRWTVAAVATAVLGNLLAAFIPVCALLVIPRGSSVRLMVEAALCLLIAVTTIIVVLVLAIISLFRERHRIVAIVAICLALAPWSFSGWVMYRVAEMRGITFKP